MGEQPVWDEFLERMEETFKEYLRNLDLGEIMEETFKEYLKNLDIGYVIQNFLERFRLEDYLVKVGDLCPVCNVKLNPSTTGTTGDIEGVAYFSCPNCLRRYHRRLHELDKPKAKFDFFEVK